MVVINPPENLLLKPLYFVFFIVVSIVLLPLVIISGLLGSPSARRRKNRLSEILANDWLPRKKNVYIGFSSNFLLADFVKESILPKYRKNIIWDEWDESSYEWKASETDDIERVTTFWQDIGGDFDGEPMLVIATFHPDDFNIAGENGNFHHFILDVNDSYVAYNGEQIKLNDAKKEVLRIVNEAVSYWRRG